MIDHSHQPTTTVLVIEDDQNIAELLKFSLESQGYLVNIETRGDRALDAVCTQSPSAVILDICLPGMDGFEICKRIRSHPKIKDTPVIMLTAKTMENDIVTGLDAGADDYVLKPFSPKVLFARLRTVLRKNTPMGLRALERVDLGSGYMMYPEEYEVKYGDERVSLTTTEFGILKFLSQNPGRVYSREQIINGVKGFTYVVTPRTIDVHVASLRKKLGTLAEAIDSIRGIGYRFKKSM